MLGVKLVEKAEQLEARQALSPSSRKKARNTTRSSNATDLGQRARIDRGGDTLHPACILPFIVAGKQLAGRLRGSHASRAIRSL